MGAIFIKLNNILKNYVNRGKNDTIRYAGCLLGTVSSQNFNVSRPVSWLMLPYKFWTSKVAISK